MQIFYSPDAQIEADASETLQTMLHVLYPTMDDKPSGIAESVIKECAELLKEPEKSKAKPATRTLVAMIKASRESGR
jgi:DNA repair/transcription protein MET18/MMS19